MSLCQAIHVLLFFFAFTQFYLAILKHTDRTSLNALETLFVVYHFWTAVL